MSFNSVFVFKIDDFVLKGVLRLKLSDRTVSFNCFMIELSI